MGLYQLAKAVDVPARRINEIVHGQRRISADTALRLARYLGDQRAPTRVLQVPLLRVSATRRTSGGMAN